MTPKLRARCALVVAQRSLGRAQPEALRAMVDAALDEGFMSMHALQAISSRPAQMEAVEPAFEDLLLALELAPAMPLFEAVSSLVRERLQALVDGEAEPFVALSEAVDIFRELDWECGRRMGLFNLYGFWSEIEDVSNLQYGSDELQEDLRASIRREATAWLAR
jgi:hypothetical protein